MEIRGKWDLGSTRNDPKKTKGENGLAILEFALVLPIFLMFLFGGIEYVNMYNSKHRVANVARQVAELINTEVSKGDPYGATDQDIQAILDPYISGIDALLAQNFTRQADDVSLRITVARPAASNPGTSTFRISGQLARRRNNNTASVSTHSTVVNASRWNVNGDKNQILWQNAVRSGVVTFIEVYYRYRPLTPVGKLFNTTLGNDIRQFSVI